MIKSQAFAMIANEAIIGNVISVVQNASRITENVLIPIAIRWIYEASRNENSRTSETDYCRPLEF